MHSREERSVSGHLVPDLLPCDLTATGPELEVDPEAGRDDLVPSVDMVVPSLVVAECD